MRKRRVNPELLGLLSSGHWIDFTVAELKAAYMASPSCPHRSDKSAWQFVYRTIIRLEKRGLISHISSNGERTRYRWNTTRAGISESLAPTLAAPSGAAEDSTLTCLKEKLHHCKVELLSAMGETEEYDAICTELPHMRVAVQALYNEARDRCSKTLGRVRALESVLSNQAQWPRPT